MEKIRVTQDYLYEYLTGHDISIRQLALRMGQTGPAVNACFKHNNDKYGKPRYFSAKAMPKLNAALEGMAGEMRQSMVTFGSSEVYTNRGGTFDPACLPAVRSLTRFFNLTAFAWRVLGWNETKKNTVLSAPSSKIYGHITEEDVMRMNAELMQVANTLAGMEVELDERSASCSSSSSSN